MGEAATRLGSGDIPLPIIYRQNKGKVKRLIEQGRQDLVELSGWTMADDFISFALEERFLEFVDRTYPSPREKTEVPIWFLICCQLILRVNTEPSYNGLKTLLKSGPILSRVGFNVAERIGFNDKNKKEREIPCHDSTVLKFFRDSKREEIKCWYRDELQGWFLKNNSIDTGGVFILDQSHLVVPDNEHYEDAILMPVDEHGQLYKGTKEEIRSYKWHRCYTLSLLLHIRSDKKSFHCASYEFGPGNEDELPQAHQIVEHFVRKHGKGVIKLLIVDRGYIDGEFVTRCKKDYGIDVLMPLRTDMHQYQDAIALSKDAETQWEEISDPEERNFKENSKPYRIKEICAIPSIALWDSCDVDLHTFVVRDETVKKDGEQAKTSYFVLCCTRPFPNPIRAHQYYRQRVRVEECYRQFKNVWNINKFSSPHPSLLESQIAFVLLTYSLLGLFLRRQGKLDQATLFITTLKKQGHDLNKRVAAYAANCFGLFGLKEYLQIVSQLKEEYREKFLESLREVNQA